MNDFERKLSQQPFRSPPPDLRDALFGARDKIVAPARWMWRDWFWPSPQAWGALAALWLIFAVLSFSTAESPPPHSAVAQRSDAPLTLLTFHQSRDLDHALELPN